MDDCEGIAFEDYDKNRVLGALRGIERLKKMVTFFGKCGCSIMITSSSRGAFCDVSVVRNEDDGTVKEVYGLVDNGRLEHSVDDLFEWIRENYLAEPRIGEIYEDFH